MRDFFISALDKVVGVIVVLLGLGIIIAAGVVSFGGGAMGPGAGPMAGGGPIAGLLILVIGAIYLILVGGFLYLGLGVYHNTRRTAEAVEKMAAGR